MDRKSHSSTRYDDPLKTNPFDSEDKEKPEKIGFFFTCIASKLARLEGFEPPAFWFVAKRSIQLG